MHSEDSDQTGLICVFAGRTAILLVLSCRGSNLPFIVRCLDSIKPLVSISEISSLHLASMAAQASLCLTWSQTLKTGFLVTRLKSITQHTSRNTVYIFGILLLIKGQPTIGVFCDKISTKSDLF